ncbi:MAG: DUF4124 domain-containing protein [Lysobacterales bacterium]|jgi:hypothetical protein
MTRTIVATVLILAATALAADTYRWKDKDGNTHYGEAVPAEYADQPYDVINDAGLVIEHVEDTTESVEIRQQKKVEAQERKPLISEEERARQYDRLLVIQYSSEDEIIEALENEVAQLGYDRAIIEQSSVSIVKAIREHIRQAADQQRANLTLNEEQQDNIRRLYARLDADAEKSQALNRREAQIRERFNKALERYLFLTSEDEAQTDRG